MRILCIFTVFSITILMSTVSFSGADPSFPKPRRNAMTPPAPSMPGANDMDNFDDMGDDEFGPPPSMPGRSGPLSAAAPKRSMSPLPPQEFDDDLGDDEFGQPPSAPARPQPMPVRSSPRQGFQQSSGMKAPQRLMPPAEDIDDGMGGEDFPDNPEGPVPPDAASLPPKNYPPKAPELQVGQTGWNQIDVHSLVQGRS